MKKALGILSVLVLITVMLVSCNAEQKVNDTVEVSFNVSSSRSLTVTNQEFTPVNSGNLTWYYHGEKMTDTEFKTGQSASMNKQESGYWTEISKGNDLADVHVTFSQGQWYFEVKAINDAGIQMYYGETNGKVLLTKENTTISISVSPFVSGVKGRLVLDGVYIEPADGNPTKVAPNRLFINGDSKSISIPVGATSLTYAEDVEPGTYTVEVKRVGDSNVVLASASKTVVVYSGLTTTIKGSVEEDTTSGTFAPVVAPVAYGTVTKEIGASDASVTLTVNNVTPSMESGKNTTVTVPKEVLGDKTSATVSVAVKQASAASTDNSFTVSDGKAAAAAIDLTLTASNSTGSSTVTTFTAPVTVNTVVAKGLSGVNVTYNGTTEGISDVHYKPDSGELSFKTKHFSTFVVETSSAAVIGDTAYETLADAIDKASDGDTVVLLNNTSVSNTSITVQEGEDEGKTCISIQDKGITIDGNGKTVTLSANNANNDQYGIYITGSDKSKTVTIKNTTINTTNLERAIRTYGRIGFKIENSTITTNGVGVHVKGANKADICNTQITVNVIGDNVYSAHKRAGVVVGGPNAEVTVDGCTINATNSKKTDDTNTWCKGLYVGNSAFGGSLTVDKTTVVADWSIGIDGTGNNDKPSNMTINGGDYSGRIGSPSGGDYKLLTINGGTFKGDIVASSFNGNGSKLVISGGTFSTDPSAYVDFGYKVEQKDGKYVVSLVTDDIPIYNANQLMQFAASVNNGTNYSGKTITLNRDIDLNNKEWTPIGTQNRPFSGTIKGNNKTISGLNNCLIKYATGNINIDGLNIKINFNDNTADFVGGLIGVYDTKNSTNITAKVLINNVDVTGSIVAKDKAGGIIGSTYNSSVGNGNDIDFKLIGCTNSATVTAKRAGGLIGTSCAYLRGDSGNIDFKLTIDGCENTAAISSPTDSDNYRAGGFIGYCGGYGNYVFNSIKNSGTDCLIGISRIGSTARAVNNQGLIKDEYASVLATDDYDYYFDSDADSITMRLWKWHSSLEQTQGSKDSSYKYVNPESMLRNDEWRFTIDGKHYKFASGAVHIRGVEDGVEQTSHVAINSDPNTYVIDGISVEYVENKSMNISGTVQNWTGWMAKIGAGTYSFDPKDYIPHNERANYTITENEHGTWTVAEKTA